MGAAYDAVLVDLDHTIFDFDASEVAAFADCLALVGVEQHTGEIFDRYKAINHRLWELVEQGAATPSEVSDRRFTELIEEFDLTDASPAELSACFRHGLGAHGALYPGVEALLDELAATVPLGLVTNGVSNVQRAKIERLGLDHWFQAISISDEVGLSKPHPAIFDHAFAQLPPSARARAMVVGDSLSSDMAGGRAAGIATCWLTPAAPDATTGESLPTEVDHRIADLAELPDLVFDR